MKSKEYLIDMILGAAVVIAITLLGTTVWLFFLGALLIWD